MEWVYMNKWAVIQYEEFILIQQLEVPHNHIYSQHRCITDNIQNISFGITKFINFESILV